MDSIGGHVKQVERTHFQPHPLNLIFSVLVCWIVKVLRDERVVL